MTSRAAPLRSLSGNGLATSPAPARSLSLDRRSSRESLATWASLALLSRE
uniref:Uncharacterized protein n=1 Tax=Arundo donax TaxID=35708 RepID=A0A0A9F3V7_ARUDO